MQMQTGTEMLILSCSLQRMDETVKGAMPMLMPELVKRARRLCFLARRAGEREEDRECFTKTRVKKKGNQVECFLKNENQMEYIRPR